MTPKTSKRIGLGAATRMCSREPKFFGVPGDLASIEEIMQILSEGDQVHLSTLDVIHHRKQMRWLRASVMALALALLIAVFAWWLI